MDFLLRQRLSVTAERDLQNTHFKTKDMRIKINDKIYRLKEIESGVDSLMELVEEYKDGDFLHSDWENENITIIYRKRNGSHLYYHVSKSNTIGLVFHRYSYWPNDVDFRLATEAEKQELLDALAKEGKRWNAEKKCVEDIPEKPKRGDLAIFWDDNKESAIIGKYDYFIGDVLFSHRDYRGDEWKNAIKFESKEQYRKLLKGEI